MMRREAAAPTALHALSAAAAVIATLAAPACALAHAQKGDAKSFATGFVHPVPGWDHVVAIIAVGLWGAQLGAPAMWMLPVTFPMVMALGGGIGAVGVYLLGSGLLR